MTTKKTEEAPAKEQAELTDKQRAAALAFTKSKPEKEKTDGGE